jgi:signal peptidase II
MMIFLIPIIWCLDQFTKNKAEVELSMRKSRYYLDEKVSLSLVYNKGAFLGWLKNKPKFLHMVTLFTLFLMLIVGLPYWLTDKGRVTGFGLALMFAGALGNYTDRVRKGHVVDFIAFGPKHDVHFNFADFAIFKGAIIMAFGQLINK